MRRNAGLTATLCLFSTLALAAPALAQGGHGHHSHRTFAAGSPGDPSKASRTIEITMKEAEGGKMLYEPARLEVKRGEQIRFVLKNVGQVDHEFMLDSVANNAKHKIQMEKNPDMEHDDPNGKRLSPKESVDLVWRFNKAGAFEFACLIPGHYEAGMRGTVVVK
jgi:uncharacterized cupredoxin-like copper-binding protein